MMFDPILSGDGGGSGGSISANATILEQIEELKKAEATTVVAGTGATDLQTAIDAASDGDIIEVQSDAVYDPITIPAAKALKIRVADGYKPAISGERCIRLSNGAKNVMIGGFRLINHTTPAQNDRGSAITFGEHKTIVEDIIFFDLEIEAIASVTGSAVLLAYHWSVSGDNYAAANTLEENSKHVSFVRCRFYHTCTDGTEGGALTLRGVEDAYVCGCFFNNDGQNSRGIQLQNCPRALIEHNYIFGVAGGNGEAIKTDMMGTCSFKSTGVVRYNRIDTATEGVDIDDNCAFDVYGNEVSNCVDEAFNLDDSSRATFERNKAHLCTTGFRCESGSVCELKNNEAWSNTTDYLMENGYAVDASNTTVALPT